MRRNTAVVLALSAFFLACAARAGDSASYCPPGAKFCPAPGANNDPFLDTHFGIDASTGEFLAFNGPNQNIPDNSHLDRGEELILVAPSVDPTNRYVGELYAPQSAPSWNTPQPVPYQVSVQYPPAPAPYAAPALYGGDPTPYSSPAPAPRAAPASYSTPYSAPGQPPPQAAVPAAKRRTSESREKRPWWQHFSSRSAPDAESEVANQTSRRVRDDEKNVANNEDKVPWWKGGLWRNRKGDDRDNDRRQDDDRRSDYDDDPVAARRNNNTGGGRPAPRMMDDDMWGDDDGYAGSGGGAPRPNANRQAPYPDYPPANNQQYGGNPYDTVPSVTSGGGPSGYDPYGAPPPSTGYGGGYDYGDSYGGGSYGVPQPSPVYSDPYASGSQYGPYDTSMYGGGDTYTNGSTLTDAAAYQTNPYGGSGGYAADPYGSGYAAAPSYGGTSYGTGYDASSSYGGGSSSWQSDPFAGSTTQSSYQADSYLDAQGGPQFENAVRMVKENRFSEAKAILASETSRNPSNAAAWRWLADCQYNLLELDSAINSYQRSLERDPNDYYALRGQGFAYLHRGHEHWRRMQEEVGRGRKDEAAATFARAHDDYKKSLELLGLCLRRAPNDGEAIYGEAMAAEGASRKLYSNAISFIKLGPDQRERAQLFAENCMTVIDKGVERSKERAKLNPGDAGPRALLGGLHLRKATLYHQLGKNDLALMELRNARDVQQSILDEIDKNNNTARRAIEECQTLWDQWGGNRN